MSDLLNRVYAVAGEATREYNIADESALPNIDRIEFRLDFYAGDERVANAESIGAPIAALASGHELIDSMYALFTRMAAERLIADSNPETILDEADEALTELLLGVDPGNEAV